MHWLKQKEIRIHFKLIGRSFVSVTCLDIARKEDGTKFYLCIIVAWIRAYV